MATTLQLLNKVQIGLRQEQLTDTSTTDAYELLLLQYLNEAKEEVEEAWCWQALRQTITVTMAASTSDYTLTAAGDADIDTTYRSKLLYETGPNGREGLSRGFGDRPQVFDVTDSGEYRLMEMPIEKIERLHLTDDGETTDRVNYFALYTDGTSLKMKVWPTPSEARTIKLRIYNPQAELASTDLTTTLTVPARPVWALALWKANQERGEEIARPGGFNELAYRNALSAAIAPEQSIDDITSHAT